MALVALVVVAAVLGSTLRLLATQQRAIVGERNAAQAQWLAEAGLERAAAQLAADPNYSGETWEISEQDFADPFTASVTIRVENDNENTLARRITAEASYPGSGAHSSRARRTIIWKAAGENDA